MISALLGINTLLDDMTVADFIERNQIFKRKWRLIFKRLDGLSLTFSDISTQCEMISSELLKQHIEDILIHTKSRTIEMRLKGSDEV